MDDNTNEVVSLSQLAKEQKASSKKRAKEAKSEARANKVRHLKRSAFLIVFSLSLLIGLTYWFAKHYYIRSPIIITTQSMVVKIDDSVSILNPVAQAQEVKPVLEPLEEIEQYRLAPFLKGIYMLESTFGQNDACKDKNLFNGYGYRQNERENKCYESFAQVTELVNDWLEERLTENGNNIIEAVCYYNKGVANMPGCDYSANFMSVLVDNL